VISNRARVLYSGLGRLADSRGGFITRFPDLDRGSGFLWQRCRYLDHGKRVVSTLNRETKKQNAPSLQEPLSYSAFSTAEVCVGEAVSHRTDSSYRFTLLF